MGEVHAHRRTRRRHRCDRQDPPVLRTAGAAGRTARTDGGYRDYAPAPVERVRFIKDAQAAGFTLAQIGEILAIRDDGHPPCDHVATLVDQRLAEVERRLHELHVIHDQLRGITARASQLDPVDCDGSCGRIPTR